MIWLILAVLALMIPLLAVVLDSHLGRALAARLERDTESIESGLSGRVALLEGEVERLAKEVERLEEQSDFLQRLIEARRGEGGALPPGSGSG